jgi:hypothetical protein
MKHILLFLLLTTLTNAQSLTDITGKSHTPFADKNTRAAVLIFITTDCPVANYFQPTIRRLQSHYTKKGIRFYLIHSDPDTSKVAAKAHVKDYSITAPVILDTNQSLAKKYGAKWTPEAAILTPDQKITYLGRIDDTYADYGKKRPKPTKNDLKDALDQVLAGKSPAETVTTKPVGCPIYFPK